MFHNLIFLLSNLHSIWFTSFVKISKQYIRYYAKYSLFNLKGSKSKVTKMELELMSVFQWGCFNSNWYAEQYNQKVIRNKNAWTSRWVSTSDSMTTIAYHFHRWVSVWCSVSLAGHTVTQLGFFFCSWLSVSWEPFSLFPNSVLYNWLFPHGDILDK